MVTCDVESKWYSRKHNIVVYWMSILFCIHNERRTKLSTSATFALKGTLLREMLRISMHFSLLQLQIMITEISTKHRFLAYCRNVRLCKAVRCQGCECQV
jgi:hypothetical protein